MDASQALECLQLDDIEIVFSTLSSSALSTHKSGSACDTVVPEFFLIRPYACCVVGSQRSLNDSRLSMTGGTVGEDVCCGSGCNDTGDVDGDYDGHCDDF